MNPPPFFPVGLIKMALFHWNGKCIVQGAAVAGAWYYFKEETDLPEFSVLGALLLVWAVYFANALLDMHFGCEHGNLYKILS